MDKNKAYLEMLRIRMIEERIALEYPKQQMRCPVHLSIGQEAAAVGVCAGIKPTDRMVSTHRSHAHYLAKGGSIKGLIGELYGRRTGCSRGGGGSMHLIDLAVNFHGSTSIVGGTIPIGVGIAFADHLKGEKHATVVCIGDAAIEEGVFHESANFASLHSLNVIFACENNLYSCYTHIRDRQPARGFKAIADAHRLRYFGCNANDLESIESSVRLARDSAGPSFIEIPTYRYVQHCGPDNDDHLGYRSPGEIALWKDMDPLVINQVKHHPTDGDVIAITNEINEAFEHAKAAPFPDESEVGKYTYASS